MGKDPAILFYTSDFLTGTMTMTDEEVGQYIRLLCLQHQKGTLTEKDMLFICRTYVECVFNKFEKDEENRYFNKRLREESIKRKNYSESRRKNISKRYEATYVEHMENENENEDININKEEKKKNVDLIVVGERELSIKEYFINLLPKEISKNFIIVWCEWVDYRKEIKKKLTKATVDKQLNFLLRQPDPNNCIITSIQNGWQGLFEHQKKSSKYPQNERPPEPKKELKCHCGKDALLWSGGVPGCSYEHILEAQKKRR